VATGAEGAGFKTVCVQNFSKLSPFTQQGMGTLCVSINCGNVKPMRKRIGTLTVSSLPVLLILSQSISHTAIG